VLIIPSSWGSQLGGHLHAIKQFFVRRCRGLKKKKLSRQLYAPTSTTRQQQFFWRRCRGERGFLQGESLASNLLLIVLLYFIFACIFLSKIQKINSFDSWFSVTFTFNSLCCSLSMLWRTYQ
jgi:hypothetical protein